MFHLSDFSSEKNIFVISDNHFEHLRCFNDFESQTRQKLSTDFNRFQEEMKNRWNNTVSKNDIVLYCGDFVINSRTDSETESRYRKWLNKLNGTKYLIKGNHDKLEKKVVN